MRRAHFFLPDEQHSRLAEIAAETGLPTAELVRRAIDSAYPPRRRNDRRGQRPLTRERQQAGKRET